MFLGGIDKQHRAVMGKAPLEHSVRIIFLQVIRENVMSSCNRYRV